MKKIIQPFIFLSLSLALGITSCNKYGKKIKIEGTRAEVYYKGQGVTEADAKKVGDFLKETGLLKSDKPPGIQITKEAERYTVRLAVDKTSFEKTPGLENVFKLYGAKMSKELFDGKKVDIALANEYFKDFKNIPYDVKTANALETPVAEGFNKDEFNHDIAGGVTFYWKGISNEESKNIADYIVHNGSFSGGTAEIYMTKDGARYILSYPVKEKYRNDTATINEIEKVSKEIKENVFPNNSYSFQMTDERLKAIKSFDY